LGKIGIVDIIYLAEEHYDNIFNWIQELNLIKTKDKNK